MNDQNIKKSIKEIVLDKIKKGEVKMRPKAHFVLKTILALSGAIILALFVLYLISFIAFALRAGGMGSLPGFGSRGLSSLLVSIPWLLILIAALLIVALEILVRRFAFSYRRPILYSVLTIIFLVFMGSFIINKTYLHPSLFQRAQEGRLPVAGEFYRDFGMPKSRDMHRGIVSGITDDGFYLKTPEGETLTVVIASETRFPMGVGIKEGDAVMVLGGRDNNTIQAFGISKINDEFNFFRQGRPTTTDPRQMLMPYRMPVPPNR
jgi:hypothetical protein